MRRNWVSILVMSLMIVSLVGGVTISKEKPKKEAQKAQAKKENPVSLMTEAMANRLSKNLHVKNIVGDPVKVGKVTIIPVIMIEVGYGGGGGGSDSDKILASGFYLDGKVKPLGFIIQSKAGVKFVTVGKAPRK